MKVIVNNSDYSFSAAAKTITFSATYTGLELQHVELITNITDGIVIYQFNKPGFLATLVGLVLTLQYDTTGMSNTDDLQIFIEADFLGSGVGLTDSELRATPVPVSGTVSTGGLTDTQLRASDVKITLDGEVVPVTGTFFQATQPISGTVTSNAGTNLNTSLLALEAGGNLASIKAKTDNIPAQGQALAAASLPVVLTAAQVTTLTPPAAITGFATSAKQDTLLAELQLKADLTETQPVNVTNPNTQYTSGTVVATPVGNVLLGKAQATNILTPLQVNDNGQLYINGSVNLTGVGSADIFLGQTIMDSSLPVVIASNQTALPITAASLPLPTGASTEATLSTLNGKIPSGLTVTASRLQVELPAGSTGLTDTELRASAVPVSLASVPSHNVTNAGTFATQATLAAETTKVIGTVNLSAAQTLANVTTLGTITNVVHIDDNAGSITVDGPLTDVQLRATPVPVSGTVTTTGLTDTQLRATPVPVSGTVTSNAGTNLNTSLLALDSTVAKDSSLSTLNTSVNTLLKPASTLTAVTTLGTITNVVHIDDNSGSITVDGPLTDIQLRTTPVPISGSVTVTGAGDATAANQVITNTEIGIVTETSPASDTASSGLNGRLQRIAQRVTSLITALGSPFQAGGSIGNISFDATQATGSNLHMVVDSGTITTVSTVTAVSDAQVQGKAASGAAKSGNPVQTGAVFNTTQPTVTTGQAVENQATARGAQIVATGIETFNTTINAALPSGTNVIGHIIADSGSTTAVTGNVTAVQPTGSNLHTVIDSGTLTTVSTVTALTAITNALPTGSNVIGHVIADTGSTTAVTGNVAVTNAGLTNLDVALSTRTKPADQQHVLLDANSGIDIGKLTANQSVNTSQVNAVTILTGTGATGTGSQRITVAVDSATVAGSASLPTGSNVIGQVTSNAGTNLNTSALALDATLTGGAQKAIARGGAKGATAAADVTSTSQSADRNALDVQIRTSAGAVVDTFGGGTQYTEDAVAAADPVGTVPILVRKDTPATIVSADGDNIAQRGTNYGAAYSQIVTSAGAFVDTFGGGTQFADGAARGTATGTLLMVDDGTNIQSAIGTTAGVLKIDLSATTANATAVKTDGSAVTQPISGSVTANAGTNLNTSALALDATLTGGTQKTKLVDSGGTNVASVDANGALAIQAGGATGSAISARAISVGGTDGTNLRAIKVSTTGVVATSIDQTTPGTTNKVSITDSLGNSTNSAATGFLKVTDEPTQLFYDSFDAALDTTNMWTSTTGSSGVAATVTLGELSLGTGVAANGYSKLISIPTFKPTIPGWVVFSDAIKISDAAAPTANALRFWGMGTTPATPSTTTPITDGYFFELSTAGVLSVVVYAGGTRTVIATGLTLATTYQRYIIQVRTDRTFFYIGTIDSAGLVATTSFQSPQSQILPKLYLAVGGPTPPASNSQILSTGAVVSDTGKNSSNLSDGTFPWRKATVKGASTAAAATDLPLVVGLHPSSPLPAGTAVIGHVINDSGSTTAVTGNVTVIQTTASNLNAQVVGGAASGSIKVGNPLPIAGVFNTTQPTVTTGQIVETQSTARGGQIVATGVDTFNVTVNAALPAGTALLGKVGIDQTTDGTTNKVQAFQQAITKATQGTLGVTTQDLKDAGRSSRTITLDSFAVTATSETLNTMSYSTDNGTLTTGTSYTVTTAKRFRLQSIMASLHTVAGNTTAVSVIVRIRINNGGAAIASSPVQFVIPIQGVAAALQAGIPVVIPIPDGYEIVAGAGIGVTTTCAGFVTTTAAPKVDISITGYEY